MYELWDHANMILNNNPNKNSRSDAILNLNKVINLRVKALNENYHFSNSPLKTRDRKIYGQLEALEILRPRLINQISSFRNNIEHYDKEAPTLNKCQDFLEICWYFLKATDSLIRKVYEQVIFERAGFQKANWLEIRIDFSNNWTAEIIGWLDSSQVSTEPLPNFIEVSNSKMETKQETINRLAKDRVGDDYHKDKKLDDVFISGKLLATKDEFLSIMIKYFKSSYL